MERKRLNASTLRSAGYDARNRVLEIELTSGSILQYSGVPEEIYRRLMTRGQDALAKLEAWLMERTLPELIALLDDLDLDDLAFLREGVECNVSLAEYGLTPAPGSASVWHSSG